MQGPLLHTALARNLEPTKRVDVRLTVGHKKHLGILLWILCSIVYLILMEKNLDDDDESSTVQ